MTIKQIKEFIVLCEYRSFSKASAVLFLTPSSLSRHITALEESLGTVLVVRNNREFCLTETGSLLFEKGSELVNQYDSIYYQITGNTSATNNTLTIYSEPLNDDKLFLVYHRFREQYPDVLFNLRLLPLVPESEKVNIEDADIIIAISEYLEMSLKGYEIVPIFNDQVCIVITKNHSVIDEDGKNLKLLENIPLLMLARNGLFPPTVKRIEADVSNFRALYKNAKRLSPTELYYNLKSGYGWTTFPKSLASEYGHDCQIIPLYGEGSELHVIMAWKKSNNNPNIKLFTQIMCDTMIDNN